MKNEIMGHYRARITNWLATFAGQAYTIWEAGSRNGYAGLIVCSEGQSVESIGERELLGLV